MVVGMLNSGAPQMAEALLNRAEAPALPPKVLWSLKIHLAHAKKDEAMLLESAEKLYEASPGDIASASNLAAALLIRRASPARALSITLELLNRSQNSVAVILNHSMALILNHRVSEAMPYLSKLDPSVLNVEEQSAYYQIRAEASSALGNGSEARTFAAKVDLSQLYATQKSGLAKILTP